MPSGIPVPAAHKRRMIRAYLAGQTLVESAGMFGYTHKTCSRALQDAGVARRTQTVAQRVYALDEGFFERIDTEEKAYWLGFIAADGYVIVTQKQSSCCISLARCDSSHLEKLRKAACSEMPLLHYTNKGSDGRIRLVSRITFNSRRLVASLLRLGITPRKSFTVKPWNGPEHLMTAYWRGAFDGDGHIGKRMQITTWKDKSYGRKPHWEIQFVGSRFMVEGFAKFINARTGGLGTVRPARNIFRVRYGGVDLPRKVAHVLYNGATVALDRKLKLAQELFRAKSKQRHLGHWTAEFLLAQYETHGRSWPAVAKALDCFETVLQAHRRRLGIYIDGRRYDTWRNRRLPRS